MRVVALRSAGDAERSLIRLSFRPIDVFRVSLSLMCVANLIRIPTIARDTGFAAPILFNDICVGAMLVSGALLMLRERRLRLDGVAFTALLFAAVGLLSALASAAEYGLTAHEMTISLAYLARWLMYFAIYVVCLNCLRTEDAPALWGTLESMMIVFCVFGIFQSAFLPNFAFMVYPDARPYLDFDPQGHRLVSTMLEPNIAAAIILTVLMPQLAMVATGANIPRWKPLLLFTALVLTLSRSGALAFAFALLAIVAARGWSRRLLRLGGAIAFVLVLASPLLVPYAAKLSRFGVTDGSAASRLVNWGRAVTTFFEHPWFGIGFNTYGFVQQRMGIDLVGGSQYSVEGGLLFVAVMTGVVGLAVYGGMIWLVVRRCRGTWLSEQAQPWEKGLAIGTTASTIAVLVASVFANSLFVPFVMEPLWMLWALTSITRPMPEAASLPSAPEPLGLLATR